MNAPDILESVAWIEAPSQPPSSDGTPHVTHTGTLDLAGFKFRCYQLSDGCRVVDKEDVDAFFGAVTATPPQP